MRHIFQKHAARSVSRQASKLIAGFVGGLAMFGGVALADSNAVNQMQITKMDLFAEKLPANCVPFDPVHKIKANLVQMEANGFKSLLFQSRTFRDIVAQASKDGVNISYICHVGSQFRPTEIDLDHAILRVNLHREEQYRAYEAFLSSHYLFRMKAAELRGVARNTAFSPQDQVQAYMVQYADAVAWTGLAAVESFLERGGYPGREFEKFKQIFPGPARAIAQVVNLVPKDGANHYDRFRDKILRAGFVSALSDSKTRAWVAQNGLPKWLQRKLLKNPSSALNSGKRRFGPDDIKTYGPYLAGLNVSGLYQKLYANQAVDPAAIGVKRMHELIRVARQRSMAMPPMIK